MTTIALVLTTGTGAVGRHVGSMARIFAQRGHNVQLYCLPDTARGHNFESMDAVSVHPLRDLVYAHKADVIHAFGYQATVQVSLLTFGTPLVSSWHQSAHVPGTSPATRLVQAAAAKAANLVLGASLDIVAEARALGAKAAFGPTSVAPQIVSSRSREELRADLALAPHDKLIVSVGRLTKLKNFDLAVDIAGELSSRNDLRFVILGSGPQRHHLLQRIVEPGLPVALLGTRGRVADLLAAADIALITSQWEARPVLAQMAMQSGIPLVATRVGGVPDLVGDGAILFDVESPATAAFAITNLIDDQTYRAELVERGHQQAATWPSEEGIAADLLARYAEVIDTVGASKGDTDAENR